MVEGGETINPELSNSRLGHWVQPDIINIIGFWRSVGCYEPDTDSL